MAKTSKPEATPAPQPPYIKRAHLRNVPPLRDVKVDFKPGLNIIIGKNGSGKTNFIKLLSLLTHPFMKNDIGVGCELAIGGAHEFHITFESQATDSKKVGNEFASKMQESQLPLLAVVTDKVNTWKGEGLYEAVYSHMRDSSYYLVTVWHGIPSYRLPVVDEGIELALPKSGRLTLINSVESRWHIHSQFVQALLATIEGVYYEGTYNTQPILASDTDVIRQFVMQAVDTHLERLNLYLPVYSPIQDVRRSDQFQVYLNKSKDELLIKELVLEYRIGDDWLPFSALSDGIKRIFYFIGELLTALHSVWVDERKEFLPFDPNKIIFLEEPELGIHPDQLQLLLQLIREVSKEHQVIMTTHSPQTLDMLSAQELDRITICEFIPGKGTQMRKLSAAKKAKAKAYLRDSGFLSEFWRFSNLEDPD